MTVVMMMEIVMTVRIIVMMEEMAMAAVEARKDNVILWPSN
jgi:hypothetical protein